MVGNMMFLKKKSGIKNGDSNPMGSNMLPGRIKKLQMGWISWIHVPVDIPGESPNLRRYE